MFWLFIRTLFQAILYYRFSVRTFAFLFFPCNTSGGFSSILLVHSIMSPPDLRRIWDKVAAFTTYSRENLPLSASGSA